MTQMMEKSQLEKLFEARAHCEIVQLVEGTQWRLLLALRGIKLWTPISSCVAVHLPVLVD